MARLGVETARWAFYTINKATFAKYSERDSPRIPWVHVGRSSRVRAPCEGDEATSDVVDAVEGAEQVLEDDADRALLE